ncbi:MAG: DUF5131 family protein [Oscillospiraceae bacterium]|nr:DUF5131 family protein [Oscillospiraceae bacterium]
MNRTKIEWCSMTWNPVTGCYHTCEYCYARKIANRFNGNKKETFYTYVDEIFHSKNGKILARCCSQHICITSSGKFVKAAYPYGFTPTLHEYRLDEPQKKTKPQTIFVCSMADLFGEWIPDSWIEKVFEACNKASQHKYLFLTKNPERYVDLYNGKLFPYLHKENMWFGTSITNAEETERAASAIGKLPINCNTFFSIEPLHMDIASTSAWANTGYGKWASWFIIGAETGNNKNKVIPEKAWIDNIISDCKRDKSIYDRMFPPYRSAAPVYMKDSLLPIMGEENMKRELPWE